MVYNLTLAKDTVKEAQLILLDLLTVIDTISHVVLLTGWGVLKK